VFAHGIGLDCGLCLSGTTAPGTPARRGSPAAAAPAAGGCQTRAGGASPFEEAEGTRLLLDRLAKYFAGESRLKKANGRMDRAR
jgi:hypothetical protein